jgi:periplasmic protein TonB
MAKPLRSEDPAPQNMQFAHFGVLNDGSQSKTSLFTSITLNIIIALCVIIIGAAAKHTIEHKKLTSISLEPVKKIEPEPIKPRIVPKIPPPPVVKVEPPKIKLPDVKLPDPPKLEVKMTQPAPVILPAPPKIVTPPPAPKIVSLAQAQPAAVPNNSPHPAPVALGQTNNPIAVSNRTPVTSAVNLGNKGASGMPPTNNGSGPASTVVKLGSGTPDSQNMAGKGNGPAVQGVKLGVVGGTGPMNATGRVAGPVNLGQVVQPSLPKPPAPAAAVVQSGPKVIFKPRPEYTAEATRLHIEGVVSVKIHVSASGAVQVIGVTSDLGHGLGESAIRAVQGTRFQPAVDASGHPVDWDGIVNVAFQLAG